MNDEPQLPPVSDQTARVFREFAEAIGQAITAYFERMQPAWEQLAEIARHPEVLEAFERERLRHVASQPCHCLCGYRHPADMGICDGEGVTTREFDSAAFSRPVHVPMCAPCLVAQGVTELAGG